MNTPEPISPNPSETKAVEQFTLLDLLLVIVDNLRLLVLGPIVAGLIVFVGSSLIPKTYESTAILKAEQVTASLMSSASVLDPIAFKLGYTQKLETDEARLELKKQIQVHLNAKDKLLTLTAQAETPQTAQSLTQAVLDQTYVKSQPRDSEKLRLQKQLEQALEREKQASQSAQVLGKKLDSTNTAGASEVAQGYAQMMRVVQESQAAQGDIERQLNGLDSSALVQEPTLPTKYAAPKRGLLTVLAVQAAGFLLLIWVFARNSLRKSSRDNTAAQKLENLKASWRKALGFSARTK
jgi:hypothetical protein